MSDPMMSLIGKLPFLMLLQDDGTKKIRPNWSRLIEMIAAIAVILWYLSNSMTRIETKMDSINSHLTSLDTKVNVIDDRVYEHMARDRR